MSKDALKQALLKCTADQDMFVYSGGIYEEAVAEAMNTIATGRSKDKVTLLLTTEGGDPNAAYRLGRFLQNLYEYIRVLIVGHCKSAGTLVTIAADELAFGPWGELGPLDVQVAKKDELMFVNSGLDSLQAFALVTGHVYTAFENYMLQTVLKSHGAVSFATASEIATRLATGLITPLAAQIDPHRLGEIDRMMAVATAYGERLDRGNLREGALDALVNDYPSHGFIIDMEEAQGELFNKVTFMSMEEIVLVTVLDKVLKGCCYEPSRGIVTFDVRRIGSEEAEGDLDDEARDARTDGAEAGDLPEPAEAPAPPNGRPQKRSKANGPSAAEQVQRGDKDSGLPEA